MVRILFHQEKVIIPLEEFKHSSSSLIISKITSRSPSEFAFTFCGKIVDEEFLKSVSDEQCLRIVPKKKSYADEYDHDANSINEKLAEFDQLLKQNPDEIEYFFEREFNSDQYVEQLLQSYPQIKNDPQIFVALTDPAIFTAFVTAGKDNEKRNTWLQNHPQVVFMMDDILKKTIQKPAWNPEMFMNMQQVDRSPRPSSSNQPVITSGELQSALSSALGMFLGTPANGQPSSQTQQQNVPPVVSQSPDFSPQLAQLHEFGFENDEINLLALEQTNGDLQAALELVVDIMQNSG